MVPVSRPTQSYASVPPFGEPIEQLANGPALDEQRMREQPVQDVFDDAGVFAGRIVWRAELDAWCGADSAHHLPLRRGTYEQAKSLILRRVACSTRVEAKGIR